MDTQAGLAWEENWFGGLEPKWTTEPDVQVIERTVRRELSLIENEPCVIELLGGGAFNKVYAVHCGFQHEYVVRVTLPVQPRFKTMSEDATIKYIQSHTNIPAPAVLKCQSERDNELGFEWMIMDRVPGTELETHWGSMSWLKKELIVRKVVSYLAQLFQNRFNRVGSLYATNDLRKLPSAAAIPEAISVGAETSTKSTAFCISQIVSIPFFWGKHINLDVPRGPFKHSREWFTAELQFHIIDANEPKEEEEGSDDDSIPERLTPEAIKARAQRLLNLLPTILSEESEEYILHHGDLHAGNILVDEAHELTGIIDWECIHTVPLWVACQMPKFLQAELERHEPPNPDRFPIYLQDDGTEDRNEMYYRHLDEYEKTQLWHFFLEEMRRVCPDWVKVYEDGKFRAGLAEVVWCFDSFMSCCDIDEWLETVETTGSSPGLTDMSRSRQAALNAECY